MRLAFPLVVLAGLALSADARADQLACNSKANAEKAVAYLEPGTLLIDFCSLCDSEAQVVKVEQARVVKSCDFEVNVSGTAVAKTTQKFKDGYSAEARYTRTSAPFNSNFDLAYVYVEVAPNRFRWLGGELGLKADVNTAEINLPKDLYEQLGQHPLPSVAAKKHAVVPPTAKEVAKVWHFYRHGQGHTPVLVELVACLEIDRQKKSDTRFDCIQPAEGAVDRKKSIYAWTSWLVPRGDEIDDVEVQFLHEGKVRTTKDMKLKGSAMKRRTYVSSNLGKSGRWTIVVSRRGKELGRTEFRAN